jgi:hypothetical protein
VFGLADVPDDEALLESGGPSRSTPASPKTRSAIADARARRSELAILTKQRQMLRSLQEVSLRDATEP